MTRLRRETTNVNTLFGEVVRPLSVKERIGFYPVSVWEPNWEETAKLKKIIGDFGQTRKIKKTAKGYGYWKQQGRHRGTQDQVSIFNPHLAQMILSAYAPVGARIYDPYAGGGTRGFMASAMGHTYYGVEIRREEVDRLLRHQKKLGVSFTIKCDDSTFHTPTENFDFSYTCPPYWNLEVYSDLKGDTSNCKTYADYLRLTQGALLQTFNALEPGSLAVWVVGNFRDKDGDLINLNGDIIRLGKEVGFRLHDELIFWKKTTRDQIRTPSFEANRRSVRVHEYILIFRKP
jgi:DNA modification methylase